MTKKIYIIATALALTTSAFAQQPPQSQQPPTGAQYIQSELMQKNGIIHDLLDQAAELRKQNLMLQQQITSLQKQLAKPAPEPKKE